MFSSPWGKYLGVGLPGHRVSACFSVIFPLCVHKVIWPSVVEIVHTSSISVSDLENQVSRMEKALSLGSLEPNLAGQMVHQVSNLLHSPPTLLAPLAQRYDLANPRCS